MQKYRIEAKQCDGAPTFYIVKLHRLNALKQYQLMATINSMPKDIVEDLARDLKTKVEWDLPGDFEVGYTDKEGFWNVVSCHQNELEAEGEAKELNKAE